MISKSFYDQSPDLQGHWC